MNCVRDHEFNKIHIDNAIEANCRKIVTKNPFTYVILRLILALSCLSEKYTICSSNAALLLNASRVNFNDMNLAGIRLTETDISGANFIRANLENSRMRKVKISSADFTEANLKGIDWSDMEVKEVQMCKGHND